MGRRIDTGRRALATAIAIAALAPACGSDVPAGLDPALGGETTRSSSGTNAFGLHAPSLTNEERRLFEVGDGLFTQNWVTAPASTEGRDGLGPLLNAAACSSCHLRDGRGEPHDDDVEAEVGMLIRLSVPGEDEHGAPLPDPVYGGQLQDVAIDGVEPEGRVEVSYVETTGTYPDGTTYTLRTPTYRIVELADGPLDPDAMISPRLAPQVIGMGLLEAVPAATVLAAADPDDADGDGISGQANMVWDLRTSSTVLGRFGWKAGQPSVEQQSVAAFNGDMGLTSGPAPQDDCTAVQAECRTAIDGGTPEVSDDQLAAITFYGRTLSVPAMRDHDDPDVVAGSELFGSLGCAACHTPTLVTGDSDIDSLTAQTIHPYTDLLLHDMGPGLADGRPEFLASGSEWRTPPLWGLGLIETVGGHRFLLHDGRARTIEEAVLWHGGEATAAADRFKALPVAERERLITFLESL